jgi:hypothetical protein
VINWQPLNLEDLHRYEEMGGCMDEMPEGADAETADEDTSGLGETSEQKCASSEDSGPEVIAKAFAYSRSSSFSYHFYIFLPMPTYATHAYLCLLVPSADDLPGAAADARESLPQSALLTHRNDAACTETLLAHVPQKGASIQLASPGRCASAWHV